MTDHARWLMLRKDEFIWPVTYRFHLSTSWGLTQHELSLDVPILVDDAVSTLKLGGLLWSEIIAPAITRSVWLDYYECMLWRANPFPVIGAPLGGQGQRVNVPASREASACWILHTGHADSLGRRRFFLPGIPRSWSSGGLLNEKGRGELEEAAQVAVMALIGGAGGGPYRWLIAYPNPFNGTGLDRLEVGFRLVEWVRICYFTDKAPEPSGEPWPY